MSCTKQFVPSRNSLCNPVKPRKTRHAVHVRCHADFRKLQQQLAAATAPSLLALQVSMLAVPPTDAGQVTGPINDHKMSVNRSVVEAMLLQQMSGRMQSLSDDELLSLLEQVQSNRFPALAAPLTNAVPLPRKSAAKSTSSLSTADAHARQNDPAVNETPAKPAEQSPDSQPGMLQPTSIAPESATAPSHPSPSDTASKPAQPSGVPAEQADASTTDNTVNAWKYRLQAFAKPLMQQMQGQQLWQQTPGSLDAAASTTAPTPAAPRQDSSANAPLFSVPDSQQQQQQQQQAQVQAQAQAESALQGTSQGADSSLTGPVSGKLKSRRLESSASSSGQPQADAGQPSGMVSSETGPQGQPEQAASARQEAAAAQLGTAPAGEEAEDATGKMLQSSGVVLPSLIGDDGKQRNDAEVAPSSQQNGGLSPVLLAYIGASLERAAPQLTLLAAAATVSTLFVLAAQGIAARRAIALQGNPGSPALGPSAPDQLSSSAPMLRIWQSAAGAVQPVLNAVRHRLKPQQQEVPASSGQLQEGQSWGWSEQGIWPRAEPMLSPSSPQQSSQQSLQQSPAQGPIAPEHDEWGRLVLLAPTAQGNGNRNGNGRQNSASNGSNQTQHSGSDRSNGTSNDTILWVRQDDEDQQAQSMPKQGVAEWKQEGHSNGDSRVAVPPAKLRLRHRRFQRQEVSREALLDNVE